MKNFSYETSALVIIDLQKGIALPYNGQEVIKNTVRLVDVFRKNGGFIAFVHVDFHDGKDRLNPVTDSAATPPMPPAGWADFVPEMDVRADDYVVLKRNWSAFFGTDLDLQLRRRKIDNIVLCGISTSMGVESTARDAFHLGYNQIFITDAMKAATQEEHDASCRFTLPKLGRLRTTEEFLG